MQLTFAQTQCLKQPVVISASRVHRCGLPQTQLGLRQHELASSLTLPVQGFIFSVSIVAACTVRSYTRGKDIPKAMRKRLENAPDSQRWSRMGPGRLKSSYTLIPTNPEDNPRPDRTSAQRHKMKASRSAKILLANLNEAISKDLVDFSVIGAAMQTCGMKSWWDALLEVRRIQTKHNIKLTPVQRNIFIAALTRAASGRAKGIVEERRARLLSLAQDMWSEIAPATDAGSFNAGLGSALFAALRKNLLHSSGRTICGLRRAVGGLK